MKISRKKFKLWGNRLLDFFFPGICPVCEGLPFEDEESYMCIECIDSLQWIEGSRCRFCGIPLGGLDFDGLSCTNCRERNFSFDQGKSMFLLNADGKRLIHEIKYHGVKGLLSDFPHWLERSPGFAEFISDSLLIPVPLHRRKQIQRGFNQSLWIAKAMASSAEGDTRVLEGLKRIRNTPSQTSLDRKERANNLKQAFALRNKKELNKHARIVLILSLIHI